jgi:lysophospholipase L1-like esterase
LRDQRIHIVLMTDSLSLPRPWNIRDLSSEEGADFDYESVYPTLLRQRLDQIWSKTAVTITNLGKRSCTMEITARSASTVFRLYGPDVAVVHVGIVDCWLRSQSPDEFLCPLDIYASSAEAIVDSRDAARRASPILFVGTLDLPERFAQRSPRQNAIIAEYNAALRKTCRRENVFFVDVARQANVQAGALTHLDGVHLSHAGHAAAADALARAIAARVPHLVSAKRA